MFSVLIITRDRLGLLQKCLTSLQVIKETHPLHLVVIVNGSDQATEDYLHNIDDITKVFLPAPLYPGAARNKGLHLLKGEWTFFIDDDAQIPPNYFSYFLKTLKSLPMAQVIGGSDSAPPDEVGLARAVSAVLSSPLCTGGTFRRHRSAGLMPKKVDETNLTSCNLWIRNHFWSKGIKFPENYRRGEETILLRDISNLTDEIWWVPGLDVWHARRSDLKKLLITSLRGGYFRAKSLKDKGGPLWFWLAPLFVILHFTIIADPPLFISLSTIWLVLVCFISMYICIKQKKMNWLLVVVFLHWGIVFSYGLGFIRYQMDRWIDDNE
jgi:glycosyltransferase involved in cell wall biosynthesis